jgi:uncharacterized membrane protein
MDTHFDWNKRLGILSILLVVVAFVGVLDTTYLSASHLKGAAITCGEFGDCAGVTTSQYSKIAGVPVAYLGFLYYASFFLLSLTIATFKKRFLALPLFLISMTGVLASLWFVFAQLVLLRAICIYCMFSALTSTTLFVLALLFFRTIRKGSLPSPNGSTVSEQV